jgi:predicted ATPase
MITQFRVQNYKALRDVTLDLTPLHVLIGPNDSGKTSILEAIGALCRSASHGIVDAFEGPWEGQSLVWRQGEQGPFIRLAVSLKSGTMNAEYELTCSFEAQGRNVKVSRETIGRGGTPFALNARRRSTWVHESSSHVPANDDDRLVAFVRESLSGVHYYRWNPKLMALPVAPDATRRFRMEQSGFGLALLLDDILGYDRRSFDRLEDQFRQIFPQVRSIKLISEPAFKAPSDTTRPIPMLQQADGKGLYFEFESSLVSAAQVSDGLLLILAYVTLLHLPEPPRVILIEEPENGIHPKRLQDVLGILRRLVGDGTQSQVLITTHSPYVLDTFRADEVSMCRKGEDGAVTTHRLSHSKTVREQLDVFTLGEIWTAEGDEKLAAGTTSGASQ